MNRSFRQMLLSLGGLLVVGVLVGCCEMSECESCLGNCNSLGRCKGCCGMNCMTIGETDECNDDCDEAFEEDGKSLSLNDGGSPGTDVLDRDPSVPVQSFSSLGEEVPPAFLPQESEGAFLRSLDETVSVTIDELIDAIPIAIRVLDPDPELTRWQYFFGSLSALERELFLEDLITTTQYTDEMFDNYAFLRDSLEEITAPVPVRMWINERFEEDLRTGEDGEEVEMETWSFFDRQILRLCKAWGIVGCDRDNRCCSPEYIEAFSIVMRNAWVIHTDRYWLYY